MISYDSFYRYLKDSPLEHWLSELPDLINKKLDPAKNGNLGRWYETMQQLPLITPSTINLNADTITLGRAAQCTENLETLLRQLQPWRKGPYNLFGIHIDTEWHSDWKWQRLAPHIQPLNNRLVLDVGCGNGYFCWRMLGAGAKRVIGIDPGMLSVMQFHTVKHFAGDLPVDVLPLGIEQIPANSQAFDSVFSMGVFYHRRSPFDHLYELASCLKPGGELVLETLVIEGENGQVLVPEDRYAQMRNVWFIPSCATLQSWLIRCGFHDVRLVNVNKTTIEEQHSTDWMKFHSLPEFLDPADHDRTCEGLPAPRRAILIASLP